MAVPVLARAHLLADREALLQAGDSEVVQPELEASATLIGHALGYFRLPEDRTVAYLERFREAKDALQGHQSFSLVPWCVNLRKAIRLLSDLAFEDPKDPNYIGMVSH